MSGNDVVWMLGVLLVAVGVWGVLDYQGNSQDIQGAERYVLTC